MAVQAGDKDTHLAQTGLSPTIMLDSEEELQAELRALLDTYFKQDPVTFLPHWQALQNRVRDLAPSLSHDTLQLAHDVTYALARTATTFINVTEHGQQCISNMRIEEVLEHEFDFGMEYMEYEGEFSEDEDEPDTNWETLRDWFLAHLAHPFPTPSQSRRLVKECYIDSEELDSWLGRMRELTHWDDLFSSWAQSDQQVMKELVKLAQKETDLGIPEHRCRTSPIQRVELERLRAIVQKVYKPGPSEWWAQLDALINASDEECDCQGEDNFSDDENTWPPSDDDDTQALVTVEPDYDLDTFFNPTERTTATSIRSSVSSHHFISTPVDAKGIPGPTHMSAAQLESLEWLDKLDRVEAEKNAAYAEVERIAIKLENGDETVAVKLEAAEIRFDEAREEEEEVATAAFQRVQALRAQVKCETGAADQASEPVVKEEYIEPMVRINDKPPIKPNVFEKLVPATEVTVKAEPDILDSLPSPFTVKTEPEVDTVPTSPKSEASDEVKAESSAEPGVVKIEPDIKLEVKEEPDVKVKTEPGFALNTDRDAADTKREMKDVAVKIESNVKLEIHNESPSPLISPKAEVSDVIVYGTFQLLDPEETQDLIASFAPLEVTLIQLDPDAIVVPSGLINLFKPDSCNLDERGEEPEVIVKTEAVEVELNDECVL